MRTLTALLAIAALAVTPAAIAKSKQSSTLKLSKGTTTLALNPDTAKVLTQDLGIAVATLNPAKAGSAGLVFPITQGRVDAKTLAGTISHTGGLSLSKDGTVVELRNFIIDTKKSQLTARVGDARLAILDLDLSAIEVKATKKSVTMSGVGAKLTQGAADALNGAFKTDALTGGIDVGTAKVAARIKTRK
jgi:hypothetical protein